MGSISTFFLVIFVDSGFSGSVAGSKPFNPAERLLIWSTFIPNDLGLVGAKRVCTNLKPDVLLSPFSTDKSTAPDRSGGSYVYHVVECSKPANG
jgi:hypothetical protein